MIIYASHLYRQSSNHHKKKQSTRTAPVIFSFVPHGDHFDHRGANLGWIWALPWVTDRPVTECQGAKETGS